MTLHDVLGTVGFAWLALLTVWRVLDNLTLTKVLVATVARSPRRKSDPEMKVVEPVLIDTVSALMNLGYSRKQADSAVQSASKYVASLDLNALLKAALKELKS